MFSKVPDFEVRVVIKWSLGVSSLRRHEWRFAMWEEGYEGQMDSCLWKSRL